MNMASTKPIFLDSKAILSYILETDDELDTLITCKSGIQPVETYDVNLYEAFGCLSSKDELKMHRIAKLLECVDILPFRKTLGKEKPILTNDRVRELRGAVTKR